MSNINDIKEKIDEIKEYLETEICQKCKQMTTLLKECEQLINEQKDRSSNN